MKHTGKVTNNMEILSDLFVPNELNKMDIAWDGLNLLQDKDGITVARITSDGQSFVLKCFQNEGFRREISNYRRLSSLQIPTIKVIASTDSAILLEDLDRSPIFRPGIREDMSDPEVAGRIAAWYRLLHSRGYNYVAQHGADLYDEANYFTLENIAHIKEKTGTHSASAWSLLEGNFDAISAMLHDTRKTLTYNDFYYTNMAVARDKSAALMFDYNLLGKGYAYSDLRNVISSLSGDAKAAFLTEYGDFDAREAALDDVVSVVVTLYLACQREQFPIWAQDLLDEMDTTFIEKIEYLRKFFP